MHKSIIAVAALTGFAAISTLAVAQEGTGVAAGAATGAAAGAIVGGPVGAAVGGVAGAATGAAAEAASRPPPPATTGTVIVEQPAPVSERTCTVDAAGNRVCTEVRR